MAHEVFVICTNYPKCDGPGVAEYRDDPSETDGYLRHHKVEEQSCGFCSVDKLVPMRMATEKEIEAYYKANPQRRPIVEIEPEEEED